MTAMMHHLKGGGHSVPPFFGSASAHTYEKQ